MPSLWQTNSLSYDVIYRVDSATVHCFILCRNEITIKRQNISTVISQCSNLESPPPLPDRNCAVKNPPTISCFIFCSLGSLQLPHSQPWSFAGPWCIIYLSVFPAWLFLGLRSGGEIKQTPFWSWQPEPEGSPPSPGLTEAAFDKGAVCYKLLRKKKETQQGALFGAPLTP